jgi:hypothetical protein
LERCCFGSVRNSFRLAMHMTMCRDGE